MEWTAVQYSLDPLKHYANSSCAVLLNVQIGESFRLTVGICEGCILLPVLFNIYLEKIMQDTLQDYHTSITMGGRYICNLRFADDIDLLGGKNHELQDITDKLVVSAGAYSLELSTEKSKVMVNSTNHCSADIHMNNQKLEEVDKFKSLGSTLSKGGSSSAEICTKIDTALVAMARLDRVWKSNMISLPTNSGCTNW